MPGLEKFTMPAALVVDEATATPTYAKITAEPWEKGFGHTLGNALRRVLLSSMEGDAVSSLRIDDVDPATMPSLAGGRLNFGWMY